MSKGGLTAAELESFGCFSLVIIQATSFCNINCDYCYLPERHLKNTLSLDLIEPIFKNLFESRFLGKEFTVCWHAGEPLSLPVSFYESALEKIQELDQKYNAKNCKVTYSFQTNGTLINQEWCDLIKKYKIKIGVSLDGPAFLHDAHRKTRTGIGTHGGTMRGISLLQSHEIDFHLITVITKESLDSADELFNFYRKNGLNSVGFNTEEIEGINQSSSLQESGCQQRYRAFLKRFWQLAASTGGEFRLREFERLSQLIYTEKNLDSNQLCTPFSMVNIDSYGNFSTFSPELLAMKSADYGDFILGNVCRDTFESVCETEKFLKLYNDVQAGVNLCKQTCQYYTLCGGGAPSNKYWEAGTFRTAETLYCRYQKKIVIDLVLDEIEASLGCA